MHDAWLKCEGQVIDGEFPLRRLLGASGHGAVFLTELPDQGLSNAAIKLLPPDPVMAQAQLSQWRTTAALAHPHLVRLFDAGKCRLGDQPLLYVLMEYADERLERILPGRPLTTEEMRETLAPIIGALGFLHARGLVQGQIKPSNILVVNDQLKLAADCIRPAGSSRPNGAKGSPYDPPEARGGKMSAAGDLWALGVTLVESLTQRLPEWTSDRSPRLILPANLPREFETLARRLLDRDPARRPSIAELEQTADFGAASGRTATAPVQSTTPSPAPTPAPSPTPSPAPVAAPGPAPAPAVVPATASASASAPPSVLARSPPPASPPPAPSPHSQAQAQAQSQAQAQFEQPGASAVSLLKSRPGLIIAGVLAIGVALWIGRSRPPTPNAPAPDSATMPTSAPTSAPSAPPAAPVMAPEIALAPPGKQRPGGASDSLRAASVSATASAHAAARAAATSAPAPALPATPMAAASTAPTGDAGAATHQEIPDVPRSARASIHGHIRIAVRVRVDGSGRVANETMQSAGSSAYFNRLATDAAKKWRFAPADQDSRAWLLRFDFSREGTTAHAVAE